MFDMLIPPQMLVDPAAIVVQVSARPIAGPSSGAKRETYEKVFTSCQDVDQSNPTVSALGAFSPLRVDLIRRLGGPEGVSPEWIEKVKPKVKQLESPRHGSVTSTSDSLFSYHYSPDKGYLGKDQVAYAVEVQGRRFKVVISQGNTWTSARIARTKGSIILEPVLVLRFFGSAQSELDGSTDAVVTPLTSSSVYCNEPSKGRSLCRADDDR